MAVNPSSLENLTPFPPGLSGNPKGSAYGSRHRAARLLDTLAENEAANLFRLIMNAAMDGDTTAMRIVADRIWPARKGRPVRLDFPENLDPFGSLGVVVKGLATGEISPEEAANVATTLLAQARLAEARHNEPKSPGPRVVYLPDNGRGDTPQVPRWPLAESTTAEPVEPVADTEALDLAEDTVDERAESADIPDAGTPVYEHHGPPLEGVADPEPVATTEPPVEPEPESPSPATKPEMSANMRRWLALAS